MNGPGPHKGDRDTKAIHSVSPWERRYQAALRMPRLECGCHDPAYHSCHRPVPSRERQPCAVFNGAGRLVSCCGGAE